MTTTENQYTQTSFDTIVSASLPTKPSELIEAGIEAMRWMDDHEFGYFEADHEIQDSYADIRAGGCQGDAYDGYVGAVGMGEAVLLRILSGSEDESGNTRTLQQIYADGFRWATFSDKTLRKVDALESIAVGAIGGFAKSMELSRDLHHTEVDKLYQLEPFLNVEDDLVYLADTDFDQYEAHIRTIVEILRAFEL